jgi:hypothetical protein
VSPEKSSRFGVPDDTNDRTPGVAVEVIAFATVAGLVSVADCR